MSLSELFEITSTYSRCCIQISNAHLFLNATYKISPNMRHCYNAIEPKMMTDTIALCKNIIVKPIPKIKKKWFGLWYTHDALCISENKKYCIKLQL